MDESHQQKIINAYGLSQETGFELLRDAIDNTVYKITASTRTFVARVSKSDKKAGIQFEANVLAHLSRKLPVPQLVLTKTGASHLAVDDQAVTLFNWIPGESLEVDIDHKPSLTLTTRAGQLLGEIHAASGTFQPKQLPPRTIETEIQAALARAAYIQDNFIGGTAFIDKLGEYVRWEKASEHACGILHLDYIPSNLLVNGDTVSGVLDFDWSCMGPFGKDLGLALAIWSLPDGAHEHWEDVLVAFLTGYNHTAPQPFKRNDYLYHWIGYVLLSETAMFLNDLNEKNEYTPESGKPITCVEQCRRYRKYLYFKSLYS